MKLELLILFILFSFACKVEQPKIYQEDEKEYFETGKVLSCMDAFELLKEQGDRNIFVQVSPLDVFVENHIPEARNIWRPDYAAEKSSPYGGLLPSRESLENLLQKLNYSSEKQLIVYDHKGNVDALRFVWILKYYGFTNFKLINGGLKQWMSNGLPLGKGQPMVVDVSNFQLSGNLDSSIIATWQDMKAALNDSLSIIIDTREKYEYLGEPFVLKDKLYQYKKGAFDRGSIPGAVHFNWSNLADLKGDHRFKTLKDMRHDLGAAGITKNKQILLYCQSGSRTSHTHFVLTELLGYPNVRNYDGSWIEWSYWHKEDGRVPIRQLTDKESFDNLYAQLERKISNEIE